MITAPQSSLGPLLMELSHRHGTSDKLNLVRSDQPHTSYQPRPARQILKQPLKSAHRAKTFQARNTTASLTSTELTCPDHGGVCNTPCCYNRDSGLRRVPCAIPEWIQSRQASPGDYGYRRESYTTTQDVHVSKDPKMDLSPKACSVSHAVETPWLWYKYQL